ncbi:glycosyltransferase [Candidatus Saccharibacteria bacterium]|nr:glycosyltransferase [Candidatus Saccharibacteria bacterium]
MKIAFFSDCYLDLTGGIVTTINAEKKELEARGHTVYVFSSSYPKSAKEREKLAKSCIYPVKSCRVFGRGSAPFARRPAVVERQILREHPEVRDFDVFYAHYEAGCSIAGLRLARKFNIPAVQVMHGREDVGEENLIPFGLRTIVAICLNWFHSWYIPHPVRVGRDDYLATTIARARMWTLMVNHANYADIVITPSQHFRDKLLHYGVSKPVHALHHGIDDAKLKPEISAKTFDGTRPLEIVWHSRVSGEKRIIPFLKALKLADEAGCSYHLSVYGDGTEMKKAQKLVRKLGLNVKFYGNTSLAVIERALQRADLDVLVSYGFDTFGMTLIEAAASGTPAFIADPDLAEVLPKGSYILAPSPDTEGMAKALMEIWRAPRQIEKMSQKMIDYRPEIRNSVKVDKLLKFIEKL